MSKIKYILTGIALISTIFSYGQDMNQEIIDESPRVYFVEGALTLMQPSGIFNRNLESSYFGLSLSFLFQFKPEKPSFIGFEYNYTFLEHAGLEFTDAIDDFRYDYGTNTSLSYFHLLYRHYLGVNLLRLEPYVEGKLGAIANVTSTTVTSPDDSEFSEFDFNNFDFNLSYSFGAGINYPINDFIYLSAKAAYYSSLSGKYDVKQSEDSAVNSSLEAFIQKRSPIDNLRYDLGVTFAF